MAPAKNLIICARETDAAQAASQTKCASVVDSGAVNPRGGPTCARRRGPRYGWVAPRWLSPPPRRWPVPGGTPSFWVVQFWPSVRVGSGDGSLGPGRQVRLPAPPVVDDPQFCLRHLAGDVVAKRRAARQLWRGGGVSAPARLRSRRRSATTARAMTSPQYKSADSLTFSGFPITRYRRWRARSGATLVAGIGARKQILARSPL
jgi:hypothetical protein